MIFQAYPKLYECVPNKIQNNRLARILKTNIIQHKESMNNLQILTYTQNKNKTKQSKINKQNKMEEKRRHTHTHMTQVKMAKPK